MTDKKPVIQDQGLSEKIFRSLFDDSPVAKCLVNLDGRFLRVNRAFCHILGYPESELLSMTFAEVTHPDDISASNEWGRNLLSGKSTSIDLEKRYLHKTGNVVWGIVRSFLLRDAGGHPLFFSTSIQDITERKRSEEMLRERGEILERIFNSTHFSIVYLDKNFNFIRVNKNYADACGYPPEFFPGKNHFNLYPNEENEAIFRHVSETGTPFTIYAKPFEYPDHPEWGVTYWDWTLYPVKSAAGTVEGLLLVLLDVTGNKKVEAALRENEIRFRAVFVNSVDAIGVSKNGVHVFVNPAYLSLFGYTSYDELTGKPIIDLIAPEEHKKIMENVKRRAKGDAVPSAYETVGLRKNGNKFDMDVHVSSYEQAGEIYTLVILRDITERKKTEKNLYLSKYMIDHIQEMILWVDPEAHFMFVNDHTCRTLGYTREELLSMTVHDIDPNFPEEVWPQHWENIKQSSGTRTIETIALHKNRRRIPIEVVINYLNFFGKEFHCCFVRDITERKKAEEKILRERDFMNAALNSLPGIFYLFDQRGRFLHWNNNFERVSECSHEEIALMTPLDFFDGTDKVLIQERIQEVFVKGVSDAEAVFISKSGEKTPYYFTGQTIQVDGKSCLIGMGIDITEQKRLHEQLRQAQKMEAIGHLAGGVAHDFNNILSAIVGYAHLTLLKLKDDDPLRMNIEHILNASDKAANLTQSLLAFSRKQLIVPKPVNINNIVFNIKKILDRIIGEDIDLKVNTSVNDLIVKVDKGQIEHALLNLATNARDAMPDGGALTITTEEVSVDEQFIHMHQEGETGKYAVITVTDTGVGMDDRTKENIFEPFFTTKEVGKGTGLGLAMVYGTIKQHEGFINVYSEHGKGTTFKIYLPLAESGVQLTEKKAATPVASGNETILWIEDDEAVRISTKSLLEESGYTVIEAADGDQAITLFRKNRDFFQLVISDVIMPRQSGKEVYGELKKIRPDIKILFVSGYSADILAKKGIVGEGINFISKPLDPEVFSRKIREVLDK